MKWYAVHVLLGHFFKEGVQEPIFVFENILLISASTHKEAKTKAEAIAHEQEGDSRGSLTIDNRPAYVRFAGIRKSVLCGEDGENPGDGTEITYNEYEFSSQDLLDRYAGGEDVTLRAADYFREEKDGGTE